VREIELKRRDRIGEGKMAEEGREEVMVEASRSTSFAALHQCY
jgi:hypothetical protein